MNSLEIFSFQDSQKVRTVLIDGKVWLVALDVAKALGYAKPNNAINRHCKKVNKIKYPITGQPLNLITDGDIIRLVIRSKLPSAERFEEWVFDEVIPQVLKTGSYNIDKTRSLPLFAMRANDNWDRVSHGFFSIISELMVRVYGKFEMSGHILPDIGNGGKEIRPDVSVGKLFPKWLEKHHPDMMYDFKMYSHKLPNGMEVPARQYRLKVLPVFIEYIETDWLINRAPVYLADKDKAALEYLPKILVLLER